MIVLTFFVSGVVFQGLKKSEEMTNTPYISLAYYLYWIVLTRAKNKTFYSLSKIWRQCKEKVQTPHS